MRVNSYGSEQNEWGLMDPNAESLTTPLCDETRKPPSASQPWHVHMFLSMSAVNSLFWSFVWRMTTTSVPALDSANNFYQSLVVGTLIHALTWSLGNGPRHYQSLAAFARFEFVHFITPGLYYVSGHYLPKGYFPMLSQEGFTQLQPGGWVILSVFLLFAIVLVFWHVKLAWQSPHRKLYMGSFVLLFMSLLTIGLSSRAWPHTEFHIHHYMWAALFAPFAIFDTKVSACCQAFLLGVCTEELSLSGVLPFFDVKP